MYFVNNVQISSSQERFPFEPTKLTGPSFPSMPLSPEKPSDSVSTINKVFQSTQACRAVEPNFTPVEFFSSVHQFIFSEIGDTELEYIWLIFHFLKYLLVPDKSQNQDHPQHLSRQGHVC